MLKYVCLFANPLFISSSGKLLSRKMKKLDYNTLAIYLSASGIVVFGLLSFAVGDGLSAWRAYEALDWLYLVCLSLSVVIMETF